MDAICGTDMAYGAMPYVVLTQRIVQSTSSTLQCPSACSASQVRARALNMSILIELMLCSARMPVRSQDMSIWCYAPEVHGRTGVEVYELEY